MNNIFGRIITCSVSVALFGGVCLGQTSASSDDDSPPPSMVDSHSPTVVLTFADGRSVALHSISGQFAQVGANAGDTIGVQFRVSDSGGFASAVSLDGAILSKGSEKIPVAVDGSGSFQIQVGTKPGLYRVTLSGGVSFAVIECWVIDASNPASNPSVVQAQ